ncbi:sugar porter family MFS transporter [Streptomyces sp. GZWMJZ-114]|uniref:sugar porter family MFS transporter n=1 Tax=Streptomyces sp. GZWMJZ-114 TaxID=2494734 RepID=UPI0010107912|nr:sugar porter family MFS transporter [Streptomyces sp. GZWMJZ-114]
MGRSISSAQSRRPEGANRFLRKITLVATLGGLLFGIDTGVISGALLYLRQDLGLSPLQEALVVTALLFPGAVAGAALGGPLADRIGRRKTLLTSAAVLALATVGCAVAPGIGSLIAARVLLGAGIGCASVTCPLYLAEMAPAERRGRMVTINELMIMVGLLVAFSTNLILSSVIDDPQVWRYMLGLAAVPAVALFIGMFLLPDSPRWYARAGRLDEARETLVRGRNADDVDEEFAAIRATARAEAHRKNGREALRLLRKSSAARRILWIGIALAVAQQASGGNAVTYYAPSVLASAGWGSSASLMASVGIGVTVILATLVGLWLLGFVPRRRMLMTGFGAMVVSHACLGASFMMPASGFKAYAMVVFMLCVEASMAMFIGTSSWLVLSEIFPMAIRGFAMGVAVAGLWLANSAISFLFPLLVSRVGATAIFFVFAAVNIVSLGFVARFVPETKDRPLEQLEADLNDGPTFTDCAAEAGQHVKTGAESRV